VYYLHVDMLCYIVTGTTGIGIVITKRFMTGMSYI